MDRGSKSPNGERSFPNLSPFTENPACRLETGERGAPLYLASWGCGREDAKEKKATIENYWVPGVNNLQQYGRWAFAEFTEVYQIEVDFEARVKAEFNKTIEGMVKGWEKAQHEALGY